MKESNIKFDTGKEAKLKYKIAEKDGKNVYFVSIKKPLKLIIGDKSIDTMMTFTTPFGEETSEKINLYIKENILIDILRLIIPLLLIIWIVGIIKKPRFEVKNHKIIVIFNGKEIYNGPITVHNGLSSLIPFTPQKGKAYDLYIKAANTKKAIIICKNSLKEGMRYDNDELEGRKLKMDLRMYEDTPLDYRPDRSNSTRYIYTDVEVPVYFISGESDYNCPWPLVKEYSERLKGPDIEFKIIENSAHSPLWENSGAVVEYMVGKLK